jgi:hypothetical protein
LRFARRHIRGTATDAFSAAILVKCWCQPAPVSWHSRTTTLLLPITAVGWSGRVPVVPTYPGLSGRSTAWPHPPPVSVTPPTQRHSSTSSRGADRSLCPHPYLPRGSALAFQMRRGVKAAAVCQTLRTNCSSWQLQSARPLPRLRCNPLDPWERTVSTLRRNAMPAPPASKQVSTSCNFASGTRHHPVPLSHIGVSASAALSLIPLNVFVWFPLTASKRCVDPRASDITVQVHCLLGREGSRW